MPAYNCEQTLEAAAASVFSQTVSGWELIIVDDASRDGTAALANNLCARDPRVRLVTNERSLGVAASRNRGIRLAKGDYLAFLDSDDRWQPKKLELQLARLEKTQADLCYTSYQLCDPARPDVIKLYRVPPGIRYRALLKENVIGCSTVLMRARRMPAQGFPCAFFHEDYALWLKLLRSGCRAVGMEEPLVSYRTGGVLPISCWPLSTGGKSTAGRRACPFRLAVIYPECYAARGLLKHGRAISHSR